MAESMLKQLADGAFGIKMTPPPDLVLSTERDSHLELALDRAAGVGYYFRFFPNHWIDHRPEAAEALDRDIARHTQALPDQERSRRALISIERHELAGSPALTILHRLGRACVMGHTLVTVERGLFEARWSASDQTTGIRDAALIAEALAAKPPSSQPEALAIIAAISFDDPIHDARFPQVALTRARAATRWYLRTKLEITQPAKPWPPGRIRHEQPSCTIVPPPRFHSAGRGVGVAMYRRVSFCGTDGVDLFFVGKLDATLRLFARARLDKLAVEEMTKVFTGANPEVEIIGHEEVPSAVMVLGEVDASESGSVRLREVRRYWVQPGGSVWFIGLRSSVAVPREELVEDVRAAASSWRPT